MTNTAAEESIDLALQVATGMLANDFAAQALDIKIEKVGPGYALLTMVVRDDMINGHASCHGGMIFTLADTAFAYACNSYNIVNVAATCSIEFILPGRLGDRLSAEATEISHGRRTGVYDVRVTDQDHKLVAIFRGRSISLNRPVIDN